MRRPTFARIQTLGPSGGTSPQACPIAYVNVAGNYKTDYVTVDIYDTTGEQVTEIYEYVFAEEAERWLTPSCRCCLLEVRLRLTLPPLNSSSPPFIERESDYYYNYNVITCVNGLLGSSYTD